MLTCHRQDHLDDPKEEPAAGAPKEDDRLATYQEYIEAEQRRLQAEPPSSRAASSGSTSSATRLEAMMSSGLGSMAMFADQMQQQALEEAARARQEQRSAAAGSGRAGQYEIDQLTASLADEGFDLDSDWGSVQNQTSTTAKAKASLANVTGGLSLLKPPSNAKV